MSRVALVSFFLCLLFLFSSVLAQRSLPLKTPVSYELNRGDSVQFTTDVSGLTSSIALNIIMTTFSNEEPACKNIFF